MHLYFLCNAVVTMPRPGGWLGRTVILEHSRAEFTVENRVLSGGFGIMGHRHPTLAQPNQSCQATRILSPPAGR